ncbi:hypothetical protein GCM10009759_15650 [Kitasatospora saccharophila]|uniref:Uncharacterized protein n=1 Tax=Kitasatospora saccharophila TaxID=407973 RepID=A0ABN2WFN8_9ACTN
MPGSARVLAGLAVLCSAPAMGWGVLTLGTAGGIGFLVLAGVLLLAVPLSCRDARSFRTLCPAIGWSLFVLSLWCSLLGTFTLTPATLVLVAAGRQARPRRRADRPHRVPLPFGVLLTTATCCLTGWLLVQGLRDAEPAPQRPDGFAATLREDSPLLGPGPRPPALRYDGSGLGHGATTVVLKDRRDRPGRVLTVRHLEGTPDETRALQELIAALPGVQDVEPCHWNRDC